MKLIKKLSHFFPSKLPINQEQISALIDDVFEIHSLPRDPTYEHAVCAAIMHLGPVTNHKSTNFFVKSVHKQIANQVAFEKIKAIQAEEKKKEEAKINLEVTASKNTVDESGLQVTQEPVV